MLQSFHFPPIAPTQSHYIVRAVLHFIFQHVLVKSVTSNWSSDLFIQFIIKVSQRPTRRSSTSVSYLLDISQQATASWLAYLKMDQHRTALLVASCWYDFGNAREGFLLGILPSIHGDTRFFPFLGPIFWWVDGANMSPSQQPWLTIPTFLAASCPHDIGNAHQATFFGVPASIHWDTMFFPSLGWSILVSWQCK